MFDVLVVGAGPIGQMAAMLLSNKGASVALVGPDAPVDGRTTAILQDGVQLLRDIGVWQAICEQTAPLQTMRIVDGTKRLIRAPEAAFVAAELGLEAFGYNIRNTDLNAALRQAVAENGAVTRISQKIAAANVEPSDAAGVTLEDGTVLRAALLVAADGRRSLLRERAGISARDWSYPQTALVMNLAHTREHDFTSTEFHIEGGPFTLVPLPGRHSSLVWVEKPDYAEGLFHRSEHDLARVISEKSHYILGDVTLTSKPMRYPLGGMIANRFGLGPVVLIGESAHAFPPIGAQGMNLGIRDIRALAGVLADHPRLDSASETAAATEAYSRARLVDVSLRTAAVDALNRSLLTGILPVHLGRGLGLFALNRVAPLRKLVMKHGLGAH